MRYDSNECLTLVFSDEQDQFISRCSYQPQYSFSVGKQFYSLPLPNANLPMRHGIFEHSTGEPGVYYEQRYGSFFAFLVSGGNPRQEKIYDNLELTTTKHYPSSVRVEPQDSDFGELLLNNSPSITKRNIDYVNGTLFLQLPKAGDRHEGGLVYGTGRLRGRWAKVYLYYPAGVAWRTMEVRTAWQTSH